ncbi:uridine kinase [uncultured Anaerococcus sp.]|uniref:uridine kinase n=1 Tax=uncultured Anaerococcus sp. TaxID=293428 RepID=UPI002615A25A|nr:uridine kinase [uncultured Anaerococcus sp.]
MSEIKIIAVAGGSASGKSSIVKYVDDLFKEELTVIGHDKYYKTHDDISFEERAKLNYDYPGAFDNELFYENLLRLQAGKSISMPSYDYTKYTRSSQTITIKPTKIILIEGILVLEDKRIRDITDTKVFIDADSDVRLQRRILRDAKERGRSLDSVLEQYIKQVKPMHEKYVEPTKKYADIIIPRGAKNTKGIEILTKHISDMIEDK